MDNTKWYFDSPYKAKLKRVMQTLGVQSYSSDFTNREAWIAFTYQGHPYRLTRSVDPVNGPYHGSDAFCQLVLALEDLATTSGHCIPGLQSWLEGLSTIDWKTPIPDCFLALGFRSLPKTEAEIEARYREILDTAVPETGTSIAEFVQLQKDKDRCLLFLRQQLGPQ